VVEREGNVIWRRLAITQIRAAGTFAAAPRPAPDKTILYRFI
jgi:hypothetical protein